jgi:acyl phosphate:glycerol-3-phosphate acyltransferase
MRTALMLLAAYVAGSVNFAVILLRLLGKQDPRTAFSGNAGTTNVYRQAGAGWAALVLLLDAGRAFGLALLALSALPWLFVPGVGTALVLGNRYPCFHGFRGGKGVASFLGYTIPLAPWGVLLSCLLWVAVYGMVRIPFIASFVMVLTLAGATVWAGEPGAAAIAGTVATVLLIFFNHRRNIATLLNR